VLPKNLESLRKIRFCKIWMEMVDSWRGEEDRQKSKLKTRILKITLIWNLINRSNSNMNKQMQLLNMKFWKQKKMNSKKKTKILMDKNYKMMNLVKI
jgi:hypothetical protein